MTTKTYTYTEWLGLTTAGGADVELADGVTQNYFSSTYTNWLTYVFSQEDVIKSFGLEGFKVNVNINQNDPAGTPIISITDLSTGLTSALDLSSNFGDRENVTVKTGAKTIQVRWYSDQFTFNVVEDNTAPVLNPIAEAQIDDTKENDSPDNITGTLSAEDAEGDTLTFSVENGVAVIGTNEVKVTNEFGTLFLNTVTGAYRFEPNDEAINDLQAGALEQVVFVVKANDGALDSGTQNIVINITGANDTPELDLDSVVGGTLNDTAAENTFADITGTLTGSDRDNADVDFELANSAPSAEDGFDVQTTSDYGTLFLNTETGAYKFVANDAAIEGLKEGTSVTFKVNATDGTADSTAADLTIQINATNDTPELDLNSVVGGTLNDTVGNDTFDDITGTLTGSDRDDADVDFELAESTSTGQSDFDVQKVTAYGTLFLNTETGAYKFVANDAAIEGLKVGTSVTFQVNATDGTADSGPADLKIQINATNDTPELNAASVVGGTLNDTAANDTFDNITGTLTGADRDDADVDFELAESTATGQTDFDVQKVTAYGTLFLNTETGAYKFVADDAAIEALKTNQTLVFKVNATDGTADSATADLTIQINATNDTPIADGELIIVSNSTNVIIPVSVLLKNDTDAENDALGILYNGTVYTSGQSISFTSSTSNSTFTYNVVETQAGGLTSTMTTVNVTVKDTADGANAGQSQDTVDLSNETYDFSYIDFRIGVDTGVAGDAYNVFIGGAGADVMTAGDGIDVFKYISTGSGVDLITGFTTGEDKIDLSAIDANTNIAGDQAFSFQNHISRTYDAATNQTTYSIEAGLVSGQDVQLKLAGNVTLTENDFVL